MPNIDADALNNPAVNFENRSTDPAAPGSGRGKLFLKNGVFYVLLDTGSAVAIGGAVALAEGQLAIGNGSDVLSALALGTEGQVVTADASGFATWDDAPTGGGGDMTKIATVDISPASQPITFSTIPGTYKDLLLTWQIRSTQAGWYAEDLRLRLNSDTGSNYVYAYTSYNTLNSEAINSSGAVGYVRVGYVPGATSTAGMAGVGRILIPNYAGTTFHKQLLAECAGAFLNSVAFVMSYEHRATWADTSAITTITLYTENSANMVAGSTATLYGIG